MRHPAYPEYKESGVQWLGQVPGHWEVWKLSHGFQNTGSGTTPPSDNDAWYDGDIPWVTTSELRESIIFDTTKKVSEDAIAAFSALKLFPKGALAIAMYGATIGRLGILGVPATTNQACCVMYGERALSARFMFLWFQAFREQVVLLSSGGGQPNISQDKIRSIRVACPPPPEQTAIADFLDRETGRIDTLVAKKRRLIALLKEKRTALISRTVTRGLGENGQLRMENGERKDNSPLSTVHSPLKDTGIEWLSQVPEGWEVKKLKYFASSESGTGIQIGPFGGMLTDLMYDDKGEFKVYGQENTLSGDFSKGQRWITQNQFLALSNYHACPGDVLFTRKGSIGGCTIVPTGFQQGIIDSDTIRLRVNRSELNTSFLLYAFKFSTYLQAQVQEIKRGAILSGLNTATIANLMIISPPLLEQTAIVAYLDRETAKIDKLVEKVEAAIARLQEYRTALITAAVTGKINVSTEYTESTEGVKQ